MAYACCYSASVLKVLKPILRLVLADLGMYTCKGPKRGTCLLDFLAENAW